MKKIASKKLSLAIETVKSLAQKELGNAAGAGSATCINYGVVCSGVRTCSCGCGPSLDCPQ